MRHAFGKIASVFIIGLLLGACRTEPVYQVQAHPITQVAQQRITNDRMTTIILEAAYTQKWTAQVVKPGQIRATLRIRETHTANCDILYNHESYSILLVSSQDLLQDDQGNIHRNYNRAVHRLEDEIERSLMRASY